MNPVIQDLANYYGVKLSDRVAVNTDRGIPRNFTHADAIYNGKDIATKVRCFCKVKEYLDHDLLHEIAHYVVADEAQRDLPEYGLGTVIYGHRLGEQIMLYEGAAIPSVVNQGESEVQERMAQLLSIVWGERFGLSARLLDTEYVSYWSEYLSIKTYEASSWNNAQTYLWTALIRLREMNLLPFNYQGF